LPVSGADLALLNRIKASVGLDIAAITPDEIVLSILAETVAVRRGTRRAVLGQY